MKIARKYMKEIDSFEEKVINTKKLIIGTINYDCNRLLSDLGFKEKLLVKEVKLIKIKLERQNVSERLIHIVKRLLFNSVSSECYVFMIYI